MMHRTQKKDRRKSGPLILVFFWANSNFIFSMLSENGNGYQLSEKLILANTNL
jgi:hypothetical protein